MRILFMGTPTFAVASLRRLAEEKYDICGVFTQPDKPKNRGMKLQPSPVKEYAVKRGIPVFQPVSVKSAETLKIVESLAPELIVVAAYGRILPEEILRFPRYGSINVHSSLLPAYRGAAPINWVILNGERETGVSIMYMAQALDAGDVIRTAKTAIAPEENALELTERLALLGAQVLSETIPTLANGTARRMPQDDEKQSYAPMLTRALSPIRWERSARSIHDQVRGLIPWPCATTELDGKRFKVYRTAIDGAAAADPGTVVFADARGIGVACGDGQTLNILELQEAGGKRMGAVDYLRGHPIKI